VRVVDVSDPEGTLTLLGSDQAGNDVRGIAVNEYGVIFAATTDPAGEISVYEPGTYDEVNRYNDPLGTANDNYGVEAYAGYLYVVGQYSSNEIMVYESGTTAESQIYSDAMVSPWTLSDNSASTNPSETMTANSGSNSLSIDYDDTNGYARFSNAIDLTNYLTLEFYINTVSPWAFAAYNDTAPHAGNTVTYDNQVHGSTYDRNLSVFTDFPTPDMLAFETIASSTSSYLNPASDLTLDDDVGGAISAYNGKILYVDFQTPGDRLTLDFGDNAGPFTVTFVTNGEIWIDNYSGSTINTASSNYPLIVTEAHNVVFRDRSICTMNGVIYVGNELQSNRLRSNNRINLTGMVMAGLLDNSFERFNITYSTDYAANPLPNFSPSYDGQDFDMHFNTGNTVQLSDYLASGIDDDLDTWEYVEIDLPDFNVTNVTYLQFSSPDTDTTNHTAWFADDIKLIADTAFSDRRARGVFTSAAIDSGSENTTWTDVLWQVTSTDPTNYIEFQMRTAKDSGGSPGTWSDWLGPAGKQSYFSDSAGDGIANMTHRDGADDQWAQYRAFLYGVVTSSPILESVDLRYND